MTMTDRVDTAIAAIWDMATELDPIVSEVIGAEDGLMIEEAGRMIVALDAAITALRGLREELAEPLARHMDRGTTMEVAGRVIQPHYPASRTKWDNEAIAAAVKPRLLYDPGTGEVRPGEDVVAMVEYLFGFLGSKMRTSALRSMDIDPDEYSHRESRPPTVVVV